MNSQIDKKKTYSVVLNSLITPSGTSQARDVYNFDWTIMPDQPYLVYFNYLGRVQPNPVSGLNVGSIYADFLLGTTTQGFRSTQSFSILSSPFMTFLGTIQPELIGSNSFLYADYTSNPPIYIPTRPNGVLPRIDITNNGRGLPGTTFIPSVGFNDLQNYILTLLFVPANHESAGIAKQSAITA